MLNHIRCDNLQAKTLLVEADQNENKLTSLKVKGVCVVIVVNVIVVNVI